MNNIILLPCTRAEILNSLVPNVSDLISLNTLEFESLEDFSVYVLRTTVPQSQMVPKDRPDFIFYKQEVQELFTKALAAVMLYVKNNPILYSYGSLGFIGSAVSGVSLNGMDPRYIDQKIYDLPPTAEVYLRQLG
jgi:hypothetical protein